MAGEIGDDIREETFRVVHEGINIRGFWYLKKDLDRAPVLIILHGIPRAKPPSGDNSYRDMARLFAGEGFLSIVFNFRGTGISEGDIGMAGWSRDLDGVIAFARGLSNADLDHTALLGFSAGASVAIYAAAHDPKISAVVSASSPSEYTFAQSAMTAAGWVELFREIGLIRSPDFPGSIREWEAEFDLVSPLKWVDLISPRPTLFIHGEEDEVIPVEHARSLFEKAGRPKDLVLIPGGKHRLRVDQRAIDVAMKWLVQWKDGQAC